jgi:hypothetical protein
MATSTRRSPYEEAEALLQPSHKIPEKTLGPNNDRTLKAVERLVSLLRCFSNRARGHRRKAGARVEAQASTAIRAMVLADEPTGRRP